MEELLACRVCLITDTKLFDIFKYKLTEPYEFLTGNQITCADGLPLYMCSVCACLLQKSVLFKAKCDNAHGILKYAQMQQMLTTDYIKTIDRELHSLTFSFTTSPTIFESVDFDVHIKEETVEDTEFIDNSYIDSVVTIKYESDEEPLMKNFKEKQKLSEYDIEENELILDNDNDNETENDEVVDELNDAEDFNDIQVVVLSKEQQINEVALRKNSFNYLNALYKCDKCFKGFITDSTFKNHMALHAVLSGSHACDVCHTRWPSAYAVRAHAVRSHERRYVCRKCNHVSKSSQSAKEHSRWHLGLTYICKVCDTSFTKPTTLLSHIRLRHPSNNCCELCGDSFIGEFGLAMHRKKAHREEDNKVKSESLCVLCGTRFRSLAALNRHTSAADHNACNSDLRPCLSCGEGFPTEEALKEHLKLHAKDDNVRCEECNRTFVHEKSYAIHYQRVHLRVRRRAPPPGRRAAAADRVVCEVCGRKCISKSALVYHQRTHTGEKPYQCTQCPKRFSVTERLQYHLRTHTGERPFKCTHCPKAFVHKSALNRHDRVHTGAKPYSCQHCGKSFSQSNSMKMHVKTVHLKIPAPCRRRRNKNE